MVAESQVKVEICLEVAEAEDGEEGGDGEEADAGGRGGAGRHHGPAGFRLRAFLLLNLDPFSFLHPVDVGPGFTYYQGRICRAFKWSSLDCGTLA